MSGSEQDIVWTKSPGSAGALEFIVPQRDPLLAALIEKLPAPDKPWPRDDREAWLNLMRAAFDIVYGRDGAPPLLYASSGEAPAHTEFADRPNAPARIVARPAVAAKHLDADESSVAA